jgi:hypothetical protein
MPTKADLEKQLKVAEARILELQDELEACKFQGGTPVPFKKGYLYLWQDRALTAWGGTKWSLRCVSLEAGKLVYYAHDNKQEEYMLTLRGCAVRDEGVKINKHYPHGKGQETPLDTVGAYFHIFSIYQRRDDDDDDEEIVPLLRFSTPSLAEKNLWITLISETCAYCDTNAFLEAEQKLALDVERIRAEEREMMITMPEARPGTLAPLIFAKAPSENKVEKRRFTLAKGKRASYRTSSKGTKITTSSKLEKQGYPPSKPMHRSSDPSYLSPEGPPQSFRGFFNLAMIVLVVSNFRLLLSTIGTYGSIFSRFKELPLMFAETEEPWKNAPILAGFLLFELCVIITYGIELLLSKESLKEGVGMTLHYVNIHTFFVSIMAIVWEWIDNPIIGGMLTGSAIILYLKLISYVQANQDYRLSDSYKTSLTLVEDLDPGAAEIEYPGWVLSLLGGS